MIRDFEAEEKELQEKLEKLRAERKQAEETKPIEVRIKNIAGNLVYIGNSSYRGDIVDIFKDTPGRLWREYEKLNAVPAAELERLISRLNERPNVTVVYNQGMEQKIHEFLYDANYIIGLSEKSITIKVKTGHTLGNIRYIPGFQFNHMTNIATLPKIEGWRIHEAVKDLEGVEYSEEVQKFIIEQMESRAKLDTIAKMEDIEVTVPGWKDDPEVQLKNFQKVATKFFETNGYRGIDADEMGLGKTPTGLASALLSGAEKVLILVPASLKVNWIRAIHKFVENPDIYVLSGRVPQAYDIAHIIAEKPRFVIINYDIIGTTAEEDQSYVDDNGYKHDKVNLRWPWIEVINLCKFDMIIMDEVHYIKNVDSQRSEAARKLSAPHILALTGTPILNRPGEFWPILHLLHPELFPNYIDFINRYTWNGKAARNVDELRTALRPTMIRRLKRDVMKELPAINRINEYGELSKKAQKVYDKILSGVWEVMKQWDGSEGRQETVTNMLVRIMRLKQVCAIDTMEETADLATRIYDSSDEGERQKKVLIFSQFKPTAFGIAQRLGSECLSFVNRTQDGFVTVDDRKRQMMVDQFQNDKNIHYLVVTEKTAKEGLNITAAMAVIFNDLFWTPAAHQQAEGRAYGRVADLHPIDSYYMVKAETICEWIMELLDAKMRLIENVVEGVNASRTDESVAMELIKRMKDEMWTSKRKR